MSSLTEKYAWLPASEIADETVKRLNGSGRLVVTAPPGAGKSTLLPLVLMESLPLGRILMLEPRRPAARSIAERMASMLGERVGERVGYRIRFETRVSAATRIEVLTEGVLLKMLIEDPTLEGVAAVIFDEFHERSLNSDVALALTLETQQIIRDDIKVLLMSATIDAKGICAALDAPLVEARGRMFDIRIEHCGGCSPRDCAERVAQTVRKALRQEEGDVLAFLPGRAEIERCAALLREAGAGAEVMPLYGQLSPEEQRRALVPHPSGRRKVVLSTPIAETSLTIEGVRIVVDSGLHRTMVFDPSSALSHPATKQISLDMATQRAGRAGRINEGVCYRLWSRATEDRMQECRVPEILEADLAPILLAIGAWGANDALALPWLTPPPPGALAAATHSLSALGALDSDGRITPRGRKLAALPCHPRIASMLVDAGSREQKALAADIAALLEERDPLADEYDCDINTRIEQLRTQRRRGRLSGQWQRIESIAAQYRRMTSAGDDNSPVDPYESGCLLASAYPERIAQRGADGRYRLAAGEYVTLEDADELHSCELLAVASSGNKIYLAAPLGKDVAAAKGCWTDNVAWDPREKRIVARRELRVGTLVIDSRAPEGDIRERIIQAISDAAPKEGLTMFDFNADVKRLQTRIAVVASWHPEMNLPAVDTGSVLDRTAEWLPFYIGKATTTAELNKIDMRAVIWGLLDYDMQKEIDRLAPESIQMPGGRRAKIDYRPGAEAPVVKARIQDCFGLKSTPRLDNGRRPVLMELLSPGFKPVQLTQDMEGFWRTTYFEIRKELRRRYPKHLWPDTP